MGFRFRKSINLGGGFRINLSKSGIGYSWGGKGFRFTKTARNTTRSTFSIPGTGISYTTESGRGRSSRSTSETTADTQHTHGADTTPTTNPYYNANGNRSSTTSNDGGGYAGYAPFTSEQNFSANSSATANSHANPYANSTGGTHASSFSDQHATSTPSTNSHSAQSNRTDNVDIPANQNIPYPQPTRIPGPVHQELMQRFKQIESRNTAANWFLAITIIVALALIFLNSTSLVILLAPGAALIFKLGIQSQSKVNIDDLQSNRERFQAYFKTLGNIATSKHAWRITQRQGITFTPNYRASDAELKRIPCTVSTTVPEPICSNESCAVFTTPEETLVFHTDKLFVLQQGKCAGVYGYADLKFTMTPFLFVETSYPIDDAHIVESVWLHRTRSGAPDLRYKHNPQIPICRYGLLEVRGRTGLHVVLMFSNTDF